jgi:hypothetical protein
MVTLKEAQSRAISWLKIYYSHSKKCRDAGTEAINTIANYHDIRKTGIALERIAYFLEKLPPEQYRTMESKSFYMNLVFEQFNENAFFTALDSAKTIMEEFRD